jgi:hypothetical protein
LLLLLYYSTSRTLILRRSACTYSTCLVFPQGSQTMSFHFHFAFGLGTEARPSQPGRERERCARPRSRARARSRSLHSISRLGPRSSLAPRGTRPRKRLLPLSTCQDLADLWSPLPALPAPSSGSQTPSCWPLQAPSIGHLLALGLDAVGLRCPSALPFSPRSVVVYRCRPCRPRRPLLCDTWTPALSSVLVLPSINLISIA